MAHRSRLFEGPPPALAAEDEDDEDEFDLTNEFIVFADAIRGKAQAEWNIPSESALVHMPLHVFFSTLRNQYNNSIDTLLQRAKAVGENARLSRALATTMAHHRWSVASARKYATMLKRILGCLQLPDGFVETLRLVPLKKAEHNIVLGKYGALSAEHPVRVRLEGWVEILRTGTRNNSDQSLRSIMSFYCNQCLPALGLDLDHWPDDAAAHVASHVAAHPDALKTIVGDEARANVKATRLQLFLKDVLGTDLEVPKLRKRRLDAAVCTDEDADGRDVHRISAEHLELLYAEARKDPRDELLFMLMLTTGLRIAGAAQILTRNVASIKNGAYEMKNQGKTKEKGNKLACFVMCPKVRELMHTWLTRHRPADEGPYVFPSAAQGGHLSTDCIRSRFQRLCRNCGLEGREFHPHALRHTNAHILLECGNTVESVSKCLNHSSTAVTEKFYLKENAAEVQSRCNVPWMEMETESEKQRRALEAIPNFLKSGSECSAGGASGSVPDADRKRRRDQRKALLQNFTATHATC